MDISRLKSIILGVLLAANLILATVLGMRSYETYRSQQTAVEDTVAALSNLGASVDRELLTADYPTLYPSEVERDLNRELEFARALVGDGELAESGSGMYELTGPGGTARLSDVGRISVTLTDEIPWQEEEYSAVGLRPEDFDRQRQLIGGAPVLSMTAGIFGWLETETLPTGTTRRVGGITHIDGGVLFGEVYIIDDTPSKSLSAALLALAAHLDDAGTPAGQVLAAELGWTADRAAPGYTHLQPAWQVETSNAGTWQVDAMTLAVTQVYGRS